MQVFFNYRYLLEKNFEELGMNIPLSSCGDESKVEQLVKLERRELDPVAAGPAAGEDGALDEAVAGGVDAEVELVELAVAGLVAVALHVGLEAGALADGVEPRSILAMSPRIGLRKMSPTFSDRPMA